MTLQQNRAASQAPYRVLAAVRDEHDLRPLLRLACAMARTLALNVTSRFLFGDVPRTILVNSPIPAMVVRRRLTYVHTFVQRVWVRIFAKKMTRRTSCRHVGDVLKCALRAPS